MNEFYDEVHPGKKIKILQEAARLAQTPEEKITVVVNINQLKQDGWIKE
jgi:hypothetical protein